MSQSPTSPVTTLAPYPSEYRSRAPEFYGFVALTSTYLLFALYLLWTLLPDKYIVALGVDWYPSREWALLLPSYAVTLLLLTYFTYWAFAIAGTPSFSDPSTITDSKVHLLPPRHHADAGGSKEPRPSIQDANPALSQQLHDVPIGIVNRVLYRTIDRGSVEKPTTRSREGAGARVI